MDIHITAAGSCGNLRSSESPGQSMTKDELRAELERQKQRFETVYGGEVVTYAAQPEPDRKPWRKRPSLLDEAFQEEIRKEQKRQADHSS
jgi:hypothetical protein